VAVAATTAVSAPDEAPPAAPAPREADGFQSSASKTLAVSAEALAAAWAAPAARAAWLPPPGERPGERPGEPFVVQQAVAGRSLRLAWTGAGVGAGSRVEVAFTPQGGGRARVTVVHRRLADAAAAAALQRYWSGALERLAAHLERLKTYFAF
jgi:uncharacterized protein YndB with AHSA1/START domain